MSTKPRFLITGAGGFIGGRIVEMLYLNGFAVRGAVRKWAGAARIGRFPIEIVLCDVMDQEQVARAMTEVTTVIHCASGPREVIVQGTRNMLQAALQQKVERFVYMSSAAVYGDTPGQVDETFPCQRTGDPDAYADSKIDAEELCWEFCKQGLPVTVIRPSIVYGPFSASWTMRFADRLQSGNWGIIKDYGDGMCNLIYVDDLVSGILLASQNKNAPGEVFNLNGPDIISWNQYFQRFNAALELPQLNELQPAASKRKSAIMEPIRPILASVRELFNDPIMKIYYKYDFAKNIMRGVQRKVRSTPTMSELELFRRNATYSMTKAQELLDYQPRFDIDAGLRLSAGWLAHEGLLFHGAARG